MDRDHIETESERPRRKHSRAGKPFLPHRISGVDLRSAEGRLYCRHFDALRAEFPEADAAAIRDLAALSAANEQAAGEALSESDPWLRSRARQDATRLSALLHRKTSALREAKAPPKETPSLAEYLRSRAGEAAE